MIPTFFVVLPFLAAFVLIIWQYHQIDPRRRILNLRFALMLGAVVAIFYYIFHAYNNRGDRHTSWMFEGIGLIWLAWGWWLLRRMPPRETY
ncbi:MAG TPA: hypothetical protein VMB73_15675 [Acetobacteraceae bacterium]|nr:hypothetical protein [Acetobacteraceae bacterium]